MHLEGHTWLDLLSLLQTDIRFRVTNSKKGVSVYWNLTKFEERLEQMRELYQVCVWGCGCVGVCGCVCVCMLACVHACVGVGVHMYLNVCVWGIWVIGCVCECT